MILFVVGFVLLIKGADILVEGATALARSFQVSDLVIGMTIVAFGTSAPELVVNIMAGFSGKSDIATGNVLGSNVANILLVPGVAALIWPLTVKRSTWKVDLPLSMAVVGLLLLLALNFQPWIAIPEGNLLSRLDGIILLGAFASFLWWVFRSGKTEELLELDDLPDSMPTGKAVALVIVGLAGLTFGGDWIVDGAVEIARMLGMSEALIGLTIIAIGTSLPEVATSAMAAKKRNSDLALGNAIGSNIFNILLVLGVGTSITPLQMPGRAIQDGLLVLAASMIVWILVLFPQRLQIGRKRGVVLLICYVAYVTYLVLREST